MLVIADTASRVLLRSDMAGTLFPVGVLTGLLGGPFFLILLWRARNAGTLR
jgi:ABC-type Fe3+-siderophore transport system permease subunit